jgi:hypothetical protein
MLSNQCEGKVQTILASLSPQSVDSLKNELVAIKEVFALNDLEDEDEGQ